jgi:hypothetical protein
LFPNALRLFLILLWSFATNIPANGIEQLGQIVELLFELIDTGSNVSGRCSCRHGIAFATAKVASPTATAAAGTSTTAATTEATATTAATEATAGAEAATAHGRRFPSASATATTCPTFASWPPRSAGGRRSATDSNTARRCARHTRHPGHPWGERPSAHSAESWLPGAAHTARAHHSAHRAHGHSSSARAVLTGMPFCLFDSQINFLHASFFGHDASLLDLPFHAGVFHFLDRYVPVLVQLRESLKL